MRVGVVRETFPGERRVALVPSLLPTLSKAGMSVRVESGAGVAAGFTDDSYAEKGAELVSNRHEAFDADVLLQVRTLGANPGARRADLELHRPGQVVIGLGEPLTSGSEAHALAGAGVTLFSLELLPRTTRTQSMDVLTSMATIAGYKAVILAAERLTRLFPMMVSAAGTLPPARVLVIGAGVAGLQAIATARRLGAVVKAYDVRPEVREEIESLGARFAVLPIDSGSSRDERGYARSLGEDFYALQRRHMGELAREADVVVTTAAVPGKPAPRLIDEAMVRAMTPGSVIVDLGAPQGGNCELTRPDELVEQGGVSILGPTNLPSTVPADASRMYARNVTAFLLHLVPDRSLRLDLDDDIVRDTLVAHGGALVNPRVPAPVEAGGS